MTDIVRMRAWGSPLRRRLAVAFAVAWCVSAPAVSMAAPTSPGAFVQILTQAEQLSSGKDWKRAAPLWERIVAANPVEGRFWTKLATARYNLKDYRRAISAYERAFALGSGSPADTAYNTACAYALLGQKDQAFAWLDRSLVLGFLDLPLVQTDADLASLRSDPRFTLLIPLADVSGLSREEGWQHDLRFLAWQIDRLGEAPYRRKSKAWFEQEFLKLAASTPHRTDTQIALDLMKVMRELGDGHSGVLSGATAEWALTLPVQFYAFEEGVFIIAAEPTHRDLLGSRVLDFGGRPVAEVTAWIADRVSRDNDGPWVALQSSYRLRHTALLHAGGVIPERDGASLRLRGLDGKERTVRLAADMSQPNIWNMKPNPATWLNLSQTLPQPAPLYLRSPGKPFWFEPLLAQKTVYLGFNSVADDKGESLAAFSARLAKFVADNPVDRLIVDLRWNNGGNSHLLTPLLATIGGIGKINQRGHLFVLIGRRTFSAGQNAATLLEKNTNAIFVGEPTGSSPNFVGEDNAFRLPYSKLNVNVSNLAWQSGWPTDRRSWIAPLIYAPPTFAAYRLNRDPALDAISELSETHGMHSP